MRRFSPRRGWSCTATRLTRTASLIWSPASTIPVTPITGAAGTPAGPAAGSRTPSALTNRPLPDCSIRSSGPGPGNCCCAGTAPWPWPSSANWPGGPGNGRNWPTPRTAQLTVTGPRRCRSSTCCCSTGGLRTCAESSSPPPRRPWSGRCATSGPSRATGWTGCSPCWMRCRPRPRPGPPWSWRMP